MNRLLLLALAATGCLERGDALEDAPCPCLSGVFVCCPSTNTCRAADDCPALDEPLSIVSVTPSVGPLDGGIEVTVEGRALTQDTTVEIGGVLCPTLERDGPTIVCLLPEGNELVPHVDVTLVNPAQIASASDMFRYDLPAFTDVTIAAGLGDVIWGSGALLFDANGDDRLDLMLAKGDISLDGPLLYENIGDLRFRDATTDALRRGILNTSSMVAADFTNDGIIDVFAGNQNRLGNASLLVGTRRDGFEPELRSVVVNPARSLPSVAAVDLDGNGLIDVLAARENFDVPVSAHLFVGMNENGEIRDRTDRYEPEQAPRRPCKFFAVGDLDRDGDVDAVCCGRDFTLFENDGAVFTSTPAARSGAFELSSLCNAIDLIDIDDDGDLDIATSPNASLPDNRLPSGLTLWENRWYPDGELTFERFGPAIEVGTPACIEANREPGSTLAAGNRSPVWLDREMDGDLDILLPLPSTRCGGQALWYENVSVEGTLAFTTHVVTSQDGAGDVTGMVAGDLDADGDVDVFVHAWGQGDGRTLYRNNAAENRTLGRYIVVVPISDPDGDATDDDRSDDRIQPGVMVELDVDGPAFKMGAMTVRSLSPAGNRSHGPLEARFGLGNRTGTVWVRTQFPDGSVVERAVEPGEVRVELRDCGDADCR